jgi:Ribonuclease G/E
LLEEVDFEPPPLPGGGEAAEERAGRRRRGGRGRRRRGREGGEATAPLPETGDGAHADAGERGLAPEPDLPPPSERPREPREPSSGPADVRDRPGRRSREREREREQRAERRERRRRERTVGRARTEEDLVEVHEAGAPEPEEGDAIEGVAPAGPVTKTLLINATEPEEVRIALLEDGKLEEIYLETGHERSAAGNIYRGRVQNVERGIGAAFVDLGRGLMGFLHVTDLPDRADPPEAGAGKEGTSVTDLLEPGQEILVQITRDSIGRKGPALTGRISLPGRYLVLTPNSERSGVSRRIGQGSERDRMRKLLADLAVPEGMGIIVRTAGESQPVALLRADLKHLLAEWEALKARAAEPGVPGVLRGESDVAERCVRDIMPADVSRVIVDDARMADRIRHLIDVWYPQSLPQDAAPATPAPAVASTARAAEAPGERGPTPTPEPDEAPPALPEAQLHVPAAPSAPAEARRPHVPEVDDFAAGILPPAPPVQHVQPAQPVAVPPTGAPSPTAPAGAEAGEPSPDAPSDAPSEVPSDVLPSDGLPSDGPLGLAPEADAEIPAPPAPPDLPKPPQVEVWTDPMPLLHAQGVETQLEDALRRMVRLPSGGSIVIDPTEALVAIDVNSGRLTDETDPEQTALVTNLEAVGEVTRQLRLRDLGGLIVIDFIDMRDRKAVRKVERALRRALVRDRARIRVDRIGPFGCVMLSRQRIRQALMRVTHEECAACAGAGRKRLLSGLALRVLREMQARVARSRGRGGIEVRAPGPVVDWLKKNRPNALRDLRQVCTGPVRLEPDGRLPADGWAMRGLAPDGPAPRTSPAGGAPLGRP